MDSIQGLGEENGDHAASDRRSEGGCFRRLLGQTNRRPYSCHSSPNVAKVCYHSSYTPITLLFRFFCIRGCSNAHNDLLTCFFIRDVPSHLFPRNLQDQNTAYACRSPAVLAPPDKIATLPIFSPSARYAKDPVFNIVLSSPTTILSTGELPDQLMSLPTKTCCMARDRDVKKSPDLRGGENMIHA